MEARITAKTVEIFHRGKLVAAQAQQPAPVLKYRRPVDRRTRPQRWRDAVAAQPP